jgi:predicted nucleic acid-binding Zn ribbon protein
MPKKRPHCPQFVPIGSVLDTVIRQYRPTVDASLLRIWDIWENAVGTSVATYARPAAFKDRILLVHVSNSTWLHHLRYMEQEMLTQVNEILGGKVLNAIKLKIGPV